MNINEIAKLANVSRATVSRYLNDGYVSEEKKASIRKVIEETGYKPSAQARQLRSRQTKLIGVILPKINSESISRMVAGISTVLSEKGYQLLLGNTNNNEKEELNFMEIFRAHQVDGLILIGTILTKEHYQLMDDLDIPLVVLGQQTSQYSCVYHDDFNAAKDLTKVLMKNGRKIAYLGVTDLDIAAGENRKKGFMEAIQTMDSTFTDETMIKKEAAFTFESGYEKTKELLQEHPDIDSIFCATDTIALGAMLYLREQNISIPNQVQITGIGDTLIGQMAAVSLTTIHYFYKTSGIEAANMLLKLLDKGEPIRQEIKIGYKLIIRNSTR